MLQKWSGVITTTTTTITLLHNKKRERRNLSPFMFLLSTLIFFVNSTLRRTIFSVTLVLLIAEMNIGFSNDHPKCANLRVRKNGAVLWSSFYGIALVQISDFLYWIKSTANFINSLFGRQSMVLNGTQWRHRRRISVLWNIPDAIFPQHLKHLSTVVRRGQVWPKVIRAIRVTLLEKGDDIEGKNPAVYLVFTTLLAGTIKCPKRPFIYMVMWRRVQSHHLTNPSRSSRRHVGWFLSPFHIILQSAVWWISGHSHDYSDRTLWWRGCNHGSATTLMT